jgi:hypothetical protein
MKTQSAMTDCQATFAAPTLHHLVNRISESLEPAARCKKSLIINNVPENICSDVNEKLVAAVLNPMMNVVIMHSENSCIRISAKLVGNVILLHVKDDGCINYDSVSDNLKEIQTQAEKMGGFVGFTSYRNKLTTIAFSFLNTPGGIAGL